MKPSTRIVMRACAAAQIGARHHRDFEAAEGGEHIERIVPICADRADHRDAP